MARSKSELQGRIRFALAQLGSQNGHHEFEHLAREFARLRVASNIIPATGPVAHWGDQGRDLETFRSYIANSPVADSTFVALLENRKIVGACSLQIEIEPKIKADVATIMDSSESIEAIYYFCEADIPVGKRHALREWAISTHHVKLEIFDGQALSEQLTDHDVWWIAQEYLSIPADAFPKYLSPKEKYSNLRRRWLEEHLEPLTFADFVEIDAGLRQSMYEKELRADLPPWLAKIREFLRDGCPERMRRKVQYEIAVVSLRGLNNLSAEAEIVTDFFDRLHGGLSPAELHDATVLLMYCATASSDGHFNFAVGRLRDYASKIIGLLDEAINHPPGKNSLCELLQARAEVCITPLPGMAKPYEMIDYWQRLLDIVPDAPLFPLEDFADLVTKLTRFLADDPRYSQITDLVDQLLEARSKGFVAAEKCIDRAQVLFEGRQFTKALQQLQRAKIRWFAAETLPKALSAMLLAATCYDHLKLFYAAKYYAAGVVYILFHDNRAELKRFLPRAAFNLCRACYGSGAYLSYMELLHLALLLQRSYAPEPFDLEKHPELAQELAQAATLRSISRRLAPDLLPVIDGMAADWKLGDDIWGIVSAFSEPNAEPWGTLPSDEIWKQIETEVGTPVFSDVGSRRHIQWSSLGITWTISFENSYELGLLGEELAATLQIIQADLAETELCLLPTRADVELELAGDESADLKEVPDNTRARWLLRIPRSWLPPEGAKSGEELNALAVASAILGQCTALTFAKFSGILESSFREGLTAKAFSVRPARQLFYNIHVKDVFNASKRSELDPPKPPDWFRIATADELKWRDMLGPGYSLAKAQEFIRNRYEQSIRPICLTLLRLTSDARVSGLLKRLHEQGLPDWQILNMMASMVTNFRVRNEIGKNTNEQVLQKTFAKWMFHDEEPDDPVFSPDFLTEDALEIAKNAAVAANLQTWGLICNLRTPDFAAIERFLDVRYHNSTDDVPHERYFPDWN